MIYYLDGKLFLQEGVRQCQMGSERLAQEGPSVACIVPNDIGDRLQVNQELRDVSAWETP